jgi:prepilin-type N-terminal cleavage/methylation domain-containing protein
MTSRTSATKHGFTLIELLCVIAIIGLLVSILLPVVNRAAAAGKRARVSAMLQAISVALDSYHDDFHEYPRAGVSNGATPTRGSDLLVRALIAPFAQAVDGLDGPGFRASKIVDGSGNYQGKPYQAYIPADKFKLIWDPTDKDKPCEIQDGAGGAILYYPATSIKPNINVANGYIGAHPKAMFDSSYGSDHLKPEAFMFMMGDDSSGSPNGGIDNGEKAKTLSPYVLWAPGPDGMYGPKSLTPVDAARCDDVKNF